MDEKKLERVLKILETANEDFATTADVTKVFEAIIAAFQDLKTSFTDTLEGTKQESIDRLAAALSEAATLQESLKQHVTGIKEELSQKLTDAVTSIRAEIPKVPEPIPFPELPDLTPLQNQIDVLMAYETPEPDKVEAEEVRDLLETLGDGEKLKIDAIENLRAELDALRNSSGSRHQVIPSQRGQIKLYDISASLDGVTKTFALPAFWRVISVQSTSTPNAFRPTVDYTTDASVPSITFTSQIDAASTLASGQSVLITYAEP